MYPYFTNLSLDNILRLEEWTVNKTVHATLLVQRCDLRSSLNGGVMINNIRFQS